MDTKSKQPLSGGGQKRMLLLMLGITLMPVAVLAEQLPVYKLATPTVDYEKANAILASMYGGKLPTSPEITEKRGSVIFRVGAKEVEIQKASGGFFARDAERLWNPNLKAQLPDEKTARTVADAFMADNKLVPARSPFASFSFAGFSETGAGEDVPGIVVKHQLDTQANYQMHLLVKDATGAQMKVPVVGGGGKFKVALGDGGAVIGFHGNWRPITGVLSYEESMSRTDAEAKFRKMASGMKILKTESFLAYYAAPSFEGQETLAPVWVVKAEGEVDGRKVPLRNAIIAATQYGPAFPAIPAKQRLINDKPPAPTEEDDASRAARFKWLDLLIPKAFAAGIEAGTSWIGPSQGLAGSPANAQGFVDNLAAAGWNINFNWGELAAWESDWNANDDSYVDAADFVFYTGHANSDGWVLNNPNDTFLSYTEVGASPSSPNDHYGQNDLEWFIIAACGPHQSSHFTSGIGNAFDRWRGIFDGLHVFLGYGAVTYDNTTEGARVTELALSGWTVIDAWFRAAWEIQPSTNGYAAPNGSTIYVTAMYATKSGVNTRNDHIWNSGTTVSDPTIPNQTRWLMWSGT